jgi:hypothetical protein
MLLPAEISAYIFRLSGNGSAVALTCKWWRMIVEEHFPNRISMAAYDYCNILAGRGEISLLKWMEGSFAPDICNSAVRGGQFETIKWLCSRGYMLDEKSYKYAGQSGNIELVELVEYLNAVPMPKSMIVWAAASGNLDMVKWIEVRGFGWKSSAYNVAARGGHLHVLKYFRQRGHAHTLHVCTDAARGGHLEVLQWLVQHRFWANVVVSREAAAYGHLHIIKWLRETNYLWDVPVIASAAAENNQRHILEYLQEIGEGLLYCRICGWGAKSGSIELVQWLRDNGCKWGYIRIAVCAVESGNLDMLKYVCENGCELGIDVMREAVYRRDVDMINYLNSIGCPYPPHILIYTLCNGAPSMFIWLVEHDYPLGDICQILANGHVEHDAYGTPFRSKYTEWKKYLKWIYDNGYCTCRGEYHKKSIWRKLIRRG